MIYGSEYREGLTRFMLTHMYYDPKNAYSLMDKIEKFSEDSGLHISTDFRASMNGSPAYTVWFTDNPNFLKLVFNNEIVILEDLQEVRKFMMTRSHR